MSNKCLVVNCNHLAIAKNLCEMHYKRVQRHGNVNASRPDDWGNRNKHPAYKTWCGLRRYHLNDMAQEWKDDFWRFVSEIPIKLENSKAKRKDDSLPWSKDNFYWRVTNPSTSNAKEYQRKFREANPKYGRGTRLKKLYGVTLEWYEEQHKKQNGLCAICGQPETAIIHGTPISLAVDHCHHTGKVRGLLCRACNNAIGALNHDVSLLSKAIDYLTL